LQLLLQDPERRKTLKEDYAELRRLLSEGGDASANAAKIIMDFLKEER
jgi:lipid-A-disaccharide synthase